MTNNKNNNSKTAGGEPAMNDPQNNSEVQPVTDQNDETNEQLQQRQLDHTDYAIRIHDPEIERVVGLGYD